jgi:hypothetical protein
MTTIVTYIVIAAAMLIAIAGMVSAIPGYEDSPSLVLPHPVWGTK